MHGTSGWEIAAALGTVGGAVATTAAVIVALVTNARARKSAREALETQLAAVDAGRKREHEVDLLLRLSERLAVEASYYGAPQAAEAKVHATSLALALPDTSTMPALALRFDLWDGARAALEKRYGELRAHSELGELARDEVARRIREVASP